MSANVKESVIGCYVMRDTNYLDRECSSRDRKSWCVAIEVRKLDESLYQSALSKARGISPTFSAFMVADVTINFKSLRLDKTGLA